MQLEISRNQKGGSSVSAKAFCAIGTCITVISFFGCSASLYKPAISTFGEGYTSANHTIITAAGALDRVSQRRILEDQLYPDEAPNETTLNGFANFVCRRSGLLDHTRKSMATLAAYDHVLTTINTAPKEDIKSLAESIYKNWEAEPALLPQQLTLPVEEDCRNDVKTLVKLHTSTIPYIAPIALVAALEGAKTVVDAANKLVVGILTITDDAVRGEKIRKYVKDSDPTVKAALGVMTGPNNDIKALCQTMVPPVRVCKTPGGPTALDGAHILRKWAALRTPWHIYSKMDEMQKKDAYKLDKLQVELMDSLQEYVNLVTTPSAGDVGRAMANAQAELLRLANGDITAAEAWAWFNEFEKQMKQIQGEANDLKDAINKLNQAVAASQVTK